VDVNGDGKLDVLSGSYSRMEESMAGLFQVLYGEGDGKFRKAEVLHGTDGAPLIIPTEGDDIDRICTRPFAVDLDGDGKLDIVSGNFAGTFFLFKGEGEGKFAPSATPLVDSAGAPLRVEMHSDPFFVDWDGDGDLDLLSGSAAGGAFLALNTGSKTAPKFAAFRALLNPAGYGHGGDGESVVPDDSKVVKPAASTRVWAADVNADGKLDLLVGDSVTLILPKEGVSLEAARKEYAALMERQAGIWPRFEEGKEPSEEEMEAAMEKYQELEKEFEKVVERRNTGYVWAYHQK